MLFQSTDLSSCCLYDISLHDHAADETVPSHYKMVHVDMNMRYRRPPCRPKSDDLLPRLYESQVKTRNKDFCAYMFWQPRCKEK